jgi:hypothetical protein
MFPLGCALIVNTLLREGVEAARCDLASALSHWRLGVIRDLASHRVYGFSWGGEGACLCGSLT